MVMYVNLFHQNSVKISHLFHARFMSHLSDASWFYHTYKAREATRKTVAMWKRAIGKFVAVHNMNPFRGEYKNNFSLS